MDLFQEVSKKTFDERPRESLAITRTLGCRQFDVPSRTDLIFTEEEVIQKFLKENQHADFLSATIFDRNGKRSERFFKKLGRLEDFTDKEKLVNDEKP